MQISTLPVYSKLADPADVAAEPELVARLPKGWQLSQHQLETYRALRDPGVDVVINTAMTGDGKSLAGLLPLLTDARHNGTLALFPTNELLQDQHASAERTLPQWGCPATWAGTLYGARLDELAADVEVLRRPEVLLRELKNHRLTLSNPDILHAILQFHYQQYGRSPDHVASQIAILFDQLTFDEFHIFEMPQVVAVLTGLLFLATQQPHLKTLFLSATPTPEVLQILERAGFGTRLCLIDPQSAGWYHHGEHPGAGWRPILQGSSISFAEGGAEDWVEVGGEQTLLAWFREHRPGAKAALIVNSVATALRLEERLRPAFAREDLTVKSNTGLTGRATRRASYEADLLIGTSTVDVGVDFRINLLVFESSGAGAFLQRLGRLGRHTSYIDRDGEEQRFDAFAAHALVPRFIYERLALPGAGQPAPLINGGVYTREELARVVREQFPQPARFEHYTRLWGRFVPVRVVQALSSKSLKATFAPVCAELVPRYARLIQGKIGDAMREWRDREDAGEGLLIQEAQSFRGGNPFDCGVLKEDASEPLTYDLFWLLSNARLELLERGRFLAELRRLYGPDAERPFQRGFQKYFFRWLGLRERREQVTVLLSPAVAAWGPERQQSAQVLPGIQVDCAGHEFLPRLNAALIDEPCVGLIVPAHDPQQLRRMLYLPIGLQLWPYRADTADTGIQAGTVTFGRDALLLDSRLRTRPLGGPAETPLIY